MSGPKSLPQINRDAFALFSNTFQSCELERTFQALPIKIVSFILFVCELHSYVPSDLVSVMHSKAVKRKNLLIN